MASLTLRQGRRSIECVRRHIATFTRDNAVFKGRLTMSEAVVNPLRQRSDDDSSRMGLQNDLVTSTTAFEPLNGEFTTASVDLTTART